MPRRTIRIVPVIGHPAVRMIWDHDVAVSDVKPAFDHLATLLKSAHHDIFIIVDLTANPRFPVAETILNALPVYRNPHVAAWLVIGTNPFARTIAQFLSAATGRSNVQWVDAEAEAFEIITMRLAA